MEIIFHWEEVPEDNNEGFLEFLKEEFDISWVKTAKIEKIDNDREIRITAGPRYLSLRLNIEKTEVDLKIYHILFDDSEGGAKFIVESENGKLNIYKFRNPEEYIYYEKSKLPPKNLDNIHNVQMNLSDEELRRCSERYLSYDYAAELFEINKGRVPIIIKELYEKRKLAIGELNNRRPYIYIKPFGNYDYAITFYKGLKEIIYRIVRIYSTIIFAPNPNNEKRESQSPSVEEISDKIASIFWWIKETDFENFGPSYYIDEQQINVAVNLSMQSEFFFLAHEFGHIFYSMRKEEDSSFDFIREIESDLLTINNNKFVEEFFADICGLLICMGYLINKNFDNEYANEYTYLSIEMALLIFASLELIGGAEFDKTHPPFSERINNIRNYLFKICNDKKQYKKFTQLADINLASYIRILHKVPKYFKEESFKESDETFIIRNEFRDLLERCSNGINPDHLTFSNEMNKLFNQGYHDIIAQEITAVGKAYSAEENIQREKIFTNESSRKIFFKFKLLAGWILTDVPEPARGVLIGRLDFRDPII